jgi:hypothetical protein
MPALKAFKRRLAGNRHSARTYAFFIMQIQVRCVTIGNVIVSCESRHGTL